MAQSFVGRILRVRFERLGTTNLSADVGLYAQGASIECWKKRARDLLLSQILEFVRVLVALKHAFAEFEWSASRRKARTRDICCQLGDFHGRRQHFTISIYALVRYVLETSIITITFRVSNMHSSTASILSALFTATLFQPFVNGQQLYGSILASGAEGDGIVTITVENNSTNNYSIEARNNLFDTYNPWQPMNITNLANKQVSLVGAEYQYGQLDDASFLPMPAGAIWKRKLNLTAYMPPDTTITQPTSKCYYVTFPSGFWAINTSNMPAGKSLATQFLTPGANALVDLYIDSNVLHTNITTIPASPATLIATAAAIPQQPAANELLGTQTVGLLAIQTDGTSIDEYLLGGPSEA